MMDKRELRARLRALHEGQAERDRQSALACARILASDLYRNARVIGGYLPLPREMDVIPVLIDALRTGRTLLLPRCEAAPVMTLRHVTTLSALIPGPYGLLEPAADAPIVPVGEAGLLLVPLEGIDPAGMRLGKGGGYYDCLLADAAVPTLGCALSWQWTAHIPADAWDRPLSACADQHGVHFFNNDK